MLTIFLFCIGVIIGSFLNVVGLRWNSGKGIQGRSFCVVCEKQLHWWELVPVVSFALQSGRCRGCKARISWQYPVVELISGIVFASAYAVLGAGMHSSVYVLASSWFLIVGVFSIYIVISIYDIRHKIIPNELVYATVILAVAYRLIMGGSLLDWLAGPIIFSFFGLIWLLSKGRAMGFGDAKLGLSVGLLLGAASGFSAIVLSFWLGTLALILYVLFSRITPLFKKSKKLTMKSEMPFAPFIIMGAFLAFVIKFDLLHVTLF